LYAAVFVILSAGSFVSGRVFSKEPASEPLLTGIEVEKIAAEIKELYYQAQEILEDLPQDRFDRAWVLEQADFEPDSIFDWIVQNTSWVPYQGVLRGAEGVLLARKGNSLDRSLLLSALLEDAGYETRLAHAQLSKATVKRVLQQIDTEVLEPVSIDVFSADKARAIVGRAVRQAEALAKIVRLPDESAVIGTESAVADHWWVEAKGESGWQSFDSLLTGSLKSERFKAVKRFKPENLPEHLFHRVTVRLVIERLEEGKIIEEIPLTHSMLTVDGPAQNLELVIVPFGFEVPPGEVDEKTEILTVAETTQDWLPLFRIGKKRIRQQGFGRDGHLESNPAKPIVNRKTGQAISAIGSLGRTEGPSVPILSAGWIEYEIAVPGRGSRVIRREQFDLIGPGRRRSGGVAGFSLSPEMNRERGMSLLTRTRILVVSSELPPIAFERAALDLWARQGPQIAAIVRLMHNPMAEEPMQRLQKEPLIPLDLLELAVARHELSLYRAATYLAGPNIMTTHDLLEAGIDLKALIAVDIVANEVEVMAGGKRLPSRVRLEQGVLDTVLEAALSPQEGPSHNTAELFARRREATGEWVKTGEPPDSSKLPAEVQARIANAAAAGRIVVAPEWVKEGTEPAWWEIDPKDGTTLGIGSKGWGVELTERAGTDAGVAETTRRGTTKIGQKMLCKLYAAASYIDDTAELVAVAGGGEPWFAAHDRNVRWRRTNLRTPADLERLLKKSCK
jgi:hypothetical protein